MGLYRTTGQTTEQRIDRLEVDVMILTSRIDALSKEQTYIINQTKILNKLGEE